MVSQLAVLRKVSQTLVLGVGRMWQAGDDNQWSSSVYYHQRCRLGSQMAFVLVQKPKATGCEMEVHLSTINRKVILSYIQVDLRQVQTYFLLLLLRFH